MQGFDGMLEAIAADSECVDAEGARNRPAPFECGWQGRGSGRSARLALGTNPVLNKRITVVHAAITRHPASWHAAIFPRGGSIDSHRSSDCDLAVLFAATQLGPRNTTAQDEVDRGRDVVVDSNLIPVDDFDNSVEGRRSLALQDRFLRSP